MDYVNKILIVDDDPQLLAINERILREAGYDTRTAESGKEGIEEAISYQPDLILLDVILPDINGVEICRTIKSSPGLTNVFIILLSSLKTRSLEQAEGLSAGADGYIARPISNRELLARVKTMLRIKNTETELRLQKEWLRVTLTSAGDGIIATDSEGMVVFINPIAEKVTGWPAQEAEGQPIEHIFPLVDQSSGELIINPIRRVLIENTVIYLESSSVLSTRDGRRVPIADSAAPIRNEDGDTQGVILLFQDVTEKLATQKELKTRLEELTSISRLSNALSESLTIAEIRQIFAKEITQLISPDAILLFIKHGRNLILKDLSQRQPMLEEDELSIHKVGECLCGLAVSENNPQYSRDIHTDSRCSWKECKEAGFKSFAAIPLISRAETVGVLGLASVEERNFANEAPIIEALAPQIAPRLHSAMLFEDLEQRVAERTTELQEIVNLMSGREVRMVELKRVIRQLRAQLIDEGLEPIANDPLLEDLDL